MAGIGFELRRILRRGSYFSELTAYLYSALISSGPWLMSVLCLSVLALYRGPAAGETPYEIFRSTIIYTYAFSLIFIGAVQLVSTRYLADRYYLGEEKVTMGVFYTCALLVLGVGAPLAAAVYQGFALTPLYKGCAVVLFLLVSMIWLSMIFLSAIKDYKSIVLAFASGSAVSVAAAIWLDRVFGPAGHLAGYTAGQAIIFFWLLSRLLTEFPPAGLLDKGLFSYYKKYWDLVAVGVLYNLGIWVDKMVFWSAPDSRLIAPWFKTHDLYEAPVFIAYLTIVPTMAIFLLKTETRFYEHYRSYYDKIMQKRSFRDILAEKARMIGMLKESVREIFIVQGSVTVLCVVFAPQIVDAVSLSPLQTPILRISLVGAFLQGLLSVAVIILFYFDLRKKVLLVSLVFLTLNWLLSTLSIALGPSFYGYGYCYACLLSLGLAVYILSHSLDNLEFLTFAKQPMS
ncbi:MAG: exopolysaccharide Pel transporter PelG [Desulfovibrionaceae bacterium]|nr:exopolysaccharide Pel transporter PelG [Desulfovibrionaceae bacterium]